jgi:hypothetical protein
MRDGGPVADATVTRQALFRPARAGRAGVNARWQPESLGEGSVCFGGELSNRSMKTVDLHL